MDGNFRANTILCRRRTYWNMIQQIK